MLTVKENSPRYRIRRTQDYAKNWVIGIEHLEVFSDIRAGDPRELAAAYVTQNAALLGLDNDMLALNVPISGKYDQDEKSSLK